MNTESLVIDDPECLTGESIDFSFDLQEFSKLLGMTVNCGTETIDALPEVTAQLPKTVAALITQVPTIAPEASVGEVSDLFNRKRQLHYLPVVDKNNKPVGIVHRLDFMNIFLSPYGRELYSRKPISLFMTESMFIEQEATLEDASRLITGRGDKRFEHQAFIITHHGHYCGMGWIMDLLEKITDLRIHSARYANPLTLLPGNVPIQEHLDEQLRSGHSFAVAYCDLDHFKPYNDVYGYERGDRIIQHVGQLLTTYTDPKLDFIGHIGGDDFIVIFQTNDWRERCQAILDTFGQTIGDSYHAADREQGGVWGKDRQGQRVFFPLLSLSIGVVQPDPVRCHSHHDVSVLATDAKRQAKRLPGNSLFIDRRRCVTREHDDPCE